MKRRTFLKKTSFSMAALAAGSILPAHPLHAFSNHNSPDDGPKLLKKTPVLVLEGTPRQRGQIHGEALRESINGLVAVWKENIRGNYRLEPQKHIDEFLGSTNFLKAIETWTPKLVEELKGMSEASGMDFNTMLAFQCIDEEWWFVRNKFLGVSAPSGDKCTVVGAFNQEDLPTLLAQNLDLPAYFNSFEVVLHIKHHDSDLQSFVRTCSGVVSMNGMNSAGIGLCLNAVLPLNPSPDGLPVAFVNRGILARKSWDEAVAFIHKIKHASGQTYNIGGPGEIGSFECSAGKVVRYQPFEGAKNICHTNHPLANDDQSLYQEILRKRRRPTGFSANSRTRLEDADKLLNAVEGKITIERIKKILSSHETPGYPICVPLREDGRGGYTAASTIMELSETPVFHFTNGPSDKYEYQKLSFQS